jgi:hypothetical protein
MSKSLPSVFASWIVNQSFSPDYAHNEQLFKRDNELSLFTVAGARLPEGFVSAI